MLPAAEQLPTAVLVHILQRVPLRLRLKSCALVSTQWAEAAAQATEAVAANVSAGSSTDALQQWLTHHGQHVKAIRAISCPQSSAARPFVYLPCVNMPHLTSLDLSGVTLELRPPPQADGSDNSSTVLQQIKQLPHLSELLLQDCIFCCKEVALWLLRWPLAGVTRLSLQASGVLVPLAASTVGCVVLLCSCLGATDNSGQPQSGLCLVGALPVHQTDTAQA